MAFKINFIIKGRDSLSNLDLKFRNRTPEIVALEQRLDFNEMLIRHARERIAHCKFVGRCDDTMQKFFDDIFNTANNEITNLSNERKVLQLKLKAANIKAGNST